MENDSCTEEPERERWDYVSDAAARTLETVDKCLSILSLSGGVMKDRTRTANRIDGLLARMMENPSSARYLPDIDRNLDYLFTSLQLDMIDIVASDLAAGERRRTGRTPDRLEMSDETQ